MRADERNSSFIVSQLLSYDFKYILYTRIYIKLTREIVQYRTILSRTSDNKRINDHKLLSHEIYRIADTVVFSTFFSKHTFIDMSIEIVPRGYGTLSFFFFLCREFIGAIAAPPPTHYPRYCNNIRETRVKRYGRIV